MPTCSTEWVTVFGCLTRCVAGRGSARLARVFKWILLVCRVVLNILLVIATVVYAILTYMILKANERSVSVARKALSAQEKSHVQNIGVQLYPHRAR